MKLACFGTILASLVACGSADVCDEYGQLCNATGGSGLGGGSGATGGGGTPSNGGDTNQGGGGGTGAAGGNGGEGGQGGSPPIAVDVDLDYRDAAGAALGGRPVLVSDEEGGVVLQDVLGVNGTFQASVFPGYQITVFEDATATDPTRYAYGAVVTADTAFVKLIHVPTVPPNASVGDVKMYIYCSDCGGATELVLSISCGGSPVVFSNPVGQYSHTFAGYRGCPGKTTFDAYAVARNGNAVIQASRQTNIALAAGNHFMPQTEPVSSQTALVWGVSGSPAGASLTRSLYASTPSGGETVLSRDQSTNTSVTMAVPDDYLAPGRLETNVFDGTTGQLSAYRRRFDTLTFASVDYDIDALARPNDITVLDTSDPARPAFEWSLEAGPKGDFVQVWMATGVAFGASPDVLWTVAVPVADAGTAKLPELPAELADFAVDTSATVTVGALQGDVYETTGYAPALAGGIPLPSSGPQVLNEYAFAGDFSVF